MKDYLFYSKILASFCENFKNETVEIAFTSPKTKKTILRATDPNYCWYPSYQEKLTIIGDIVEICDLFGIDYLSENKHVMTQNIGYLNAPESIETKDDFEHYLDRIKEFFEDTQEALTTKLKLLDKQETDRLNEALNCYLNGCYFSTVAMSVSAIESRLLSLMKAKNAGLGKKRLTLGQLLEEYETNQAMYGSIIPEKHQSLPKYCNAYRTFSVHPKKEVISKTTATSIIYAAFAFLLDEKARRTSKIK